MSFGGMVFIIDRLAEFVGRKLIYKAEFNSKFY